MSTFADTSIERHVVARLCADARDFGAGGSPGRSRTAVPTSAIEDQLIGLREEHLSAFQGLLTGLGPLSRYRRFGYPATDHALRGHARRALREAVWVGGLFSARHLRGVVEMREIPAREAAELAFVVAAEWRQRGIASILRDAAVDRAAVLGMRSVEMIFDPSNWRMQRLAARLRPCFEFGLDEIVARASVSACIAGRRAGWPPSQSDRPRPEPDEIELED